MRNKKIIYVIIVLGFLFAGAFYLRSSKKEEIILVTEFDLESMDQDSSVGIQEESTQETLLYVHIAGEIKHPGVYSIIPGQRVFEVIEMAGGFTAFAREDYLNQAMEVSDGMQILVPHIDDLVIETEQIAGTFKVNINQATKEDLMTLSGIGESRAEDIINYRTEHGDFEAIEDIMQISGIKEAAFEKIKDDIRVK